MQKTESTTFIGKNVAVVVERPLGSTHPKHANIKYSVNYGYVPETTSGDGEELDAYVLGVSQPLETFEGKCIAVIRRLTEDDDKLVVVPEGKTYTNEQIRQETAFQERFFPSVILFGEEGKNSR